MYRNCDRIYGNCDRILYQRDCICLVSAFISQVDVNPVGKFAQYPRLQN
jgi:hypothetical protein